MIRSQRSWHLTIWSIGGSLVFLVFLWALFAWGADPAPAPDHLAGGPR